MSRIHHVIKNADSPDEHIQLLKQVAEVSKEKGLGKERKIYSDIKKIGMGAQAERNAAHMISHYVLSLKKTKCVVINDLRLEIDGASAQIDHLLLTDKGTAILFETKSFSTGIKVDEDDRFHRWDEFRKRYEEIPSPVKQSERHLPVLLRALDEVGYKVIQSLNIVLVDYKAKLIKPKQGYPHLCRPDGIAEAVEGTLQRTGLVQALGVVGKMLAQKRLSMDELIDKAEALCELHTPPEFDVWQHYGVPEPDAQTSTPAPSPINDATPTAEGKKRSQKSPKAKSEVPKAPVSPSVASHPPSAQVEDASTEKEKLTSTDMAKHLKIKSEVLHEMAEAAGLIEKSDKSYFTLTKAGKEAGMEHRRGKFGWYFLWPRDIALNGTFKAS